MSERAGVVTSRNPLWPARHAPVRAPAGPGPAALRSARLHLPRGCATYQFAPGVFSALAAAAGGALGFVPRSALVGCVRRAAVGPATAAGRVLTGLVQVSIAAAALVLLVAALRHRRFRVLATVAGGFAAAAALMAGITYLAGPGGSAALPAGLRQGSWLTGAGFPDPAVPAGLAAVPGAA